MKKEIGEVRYLALVDIDVSEYEYNYRINGQIVVDPYAKAIAGRKIWGRKRDVSKHEVRGILYNEQYDWEGDVPLCLPYHSVIAYSLHIRGFTKHSSSKVENKGTFYGVVEKIPYLKDLGINQIQCMPVYDFEECQQYRNYWGYGSAYWFAPKGAYAASEDAVRELKDMVRSCHQAGIEVVLEMPFNEDISKQTMEECLRHYMIEYHIDGFILNPNVAPMDAIYADPILKKTKILVHRIDFQTVMRRFLKGDEGMVTGVMYWLRRNSENDGTLNCITGQNGFTLFDLVSYDRKHNEENGENNQDGPEYNYSWNCGAEGPTRKKAVMKLRNNQMRNAFFLLLLAQGTPCILAGDEFANSQDGNNNAYCQDNEISWLNWDQLKDNRELFEFFKFMIAYRHKHPVIRQKLPNAVCGMEPLHIHNINAEEMTIPRDAKTFSVSFAGYNPDTGKDDLVYVSVNTHWEDVRITLPWLNLRTAWYLSANTWGDGQGRYYYPEGDETRIDHEFIMRPRSVAVFTGRGI